MHVNLNDFQIKNVGPISNGFIDRSCASFRSAIEFVRSLPYGRNTSRVDFLLVLEEGKGTCSTKHGLLKMLADEQQQPIDLLMVFYKMKATNTPGIGTVISDASLDYIPEAHCVIGWNNKIIDATSNFSNFENIAADVLQTTSIQPIDIGANKVKWHKEYMQEWCEEQHLNFDLVWQVREACIEALSN